MQNHIWNVSITCDTECQTGCLTIREWSYLGWGMECRAPTGGEMNILSELIYLLPSTNAKLLSEIKGSSLDAIFFKFVIAVKGGRCDNAPRASWSLATFTGIGQTSSTCSCSHLCPPQTKCPLIFQQPLWIRSIFSLHFSDISSISSFLTCSRWFTCRDTSSRIARYFAFIRPSENRGRRRCTDSPSRLSSEEILLLNTGALLKSRTVGWNKLPGCNVLNSSATSFLTRAKWYSRVFTLEDMKILHLFLFKKVVKLWLNGSKKECKQGLDHSSITDSCDTVRCRMADCIHHLYLCVGHNGGHTEHFLRIQIFFLIFSVFLRLSGHMYISCHIIM